MAHLIPCKKTIIEEKRAKFFIDNGYRYHGLPEDIIFDHGPQFIFKF